MKFVFQCLHDDTGGAEWHRGDSRVLPGCPCGHFKEMKTAISNRKQKGSIGKLSVFKLSLLKFTHEKSVAKYFHHV